MAEGHLIKQEKAVEILKEAWASIKHDDDGTIGKEQAHHICTVVHQKLVAWKESKGLETKPFNEELFEKAFAAADKDGSGKLAYPEVEAFVLKVGINRGYIEP